jgi:two-component system NtrC family sensor kinase
MTTSKLEILVVDDQQPILDDFQQLLAPPPAAYDEILDALAVELGATTVGQKSAPAYALSCVQQGLDAVRLHARAVQAGRAFAVAFVDIQMPPGIDGIETVSRLWRAQPDLEVVLCTAYSDYSWHSILDRLQRSDQLVILRKPFDPIEVRQLAACLSEKWRRGRALARRMEELEAQVRDEVTRRLDVELRNVQKFEALGRLAAGVAHEINTPMQYIQSSLDFIGDTIRELDAADIAAVSAAIESIPGSLDDACDGVRRVTTIVRSVREYAHSRQDRGPEIVDVNAQVRMVVELARAQYKHHADLVLELGEVPPVLGNADMLGRALLNLVVNAGQAVASRGDHQHGKITIRTRAVGDEVAIDVEDTGIGIPHELWPRVFEPFFTTKERGQGTGQGLAMVRSAIVDVHHGRITFDSNVGIGTAFHIAIPSRTRSEAA